MARRRHFRRAPLLYGVNTLGAVAGALVTGFFLIEAFGVFLALVSAVVVGLLVSGIAGSVERRPARAGTPAPVPGPIAAPGAAAGPVPRLHARGAFLCGLLD